ncbi:MAG TPA: ABC transporter substrate-binding protein [Stellaceae bacterium]|nr:ABC transporter substrate-binding protein [Stellaceae bacterium]
MFLRRFLICAAMAFTAVAAHAETLNVAKGGPQSFSFAPVDVGLAEGFFQKRGLELKVSNFDGATKVHQAIASGDIDIALASGPDMAFIAKGSPAKSVAAMAGAPNMMVLVTLSDSPIKSPADMKGRTISVTSAGSLTNWLAHELSRQEGWGENGINVLSLGGNQAQLAALKTHQTDSMVMDLTAAYKLEEEGQVRLLLKFGLIAPAFHMHVIHASNAILARDPDAVRRFLAAWFETIAFMRANRQETDQITAKVMGVSEHLADRTYAEVMPVLSTNGCFDPKALAVLRRSYVEIGLLDKEPDMSTLYTEKYLPGPCNE